MGQTKCYNILLTFLPVRLFNAFPIDFQFDFDPNIPCNNITGEPEDAEDSLSSMIVYASLGRLRVEKYLTQHEKAATLS